MNYDFIVVGSGAGGATLSLELAKKGRKVLVVETGSNVFRCLLYLKNRLKELIYFRLMAPEVQPY